MKDEGLEVDAFLQWSNLVIPRQLQHGVIRFSRTYLLALSHFRCYTQLLCLYCTVDFVLTTTRLLCLAIKYHQFFVRCFAAVSFLACYTAGFMCHYSSAVSCAIPSIVLARGGVHSCTARASTCTSGMLPA